MTMKPARTRGRPRKQPAATVTTLEDQDVSDVAEQHRRAAAILDAMVAGGAPRRPGTKPEEPACQADISGGTA